MKRCVLPNVLNKESTEYNSGLSDFMRNAGPEEKKKVFLKVAKLATEDQRRVMQNASVK